MNDDWYCILVLFSVNCLTICIRAVKDTTDIVYHRIMSPWLWSDWIFNLTKHGHRMKRCLQTLHSFTQEKIKDKLRYSSWKLKFNINQTQELNFHFEFYSSQKQIFDAPDKSWFSLVPRHLFVYHFSNQSNYDYVKL